MTSTDELEALYSGFTFQATLWVSAPRPDRAAVSSIVDVMHADTRSVRFSLHLQIRRC
jgi:hypothetical protein